MPVSGIEETGVKPSVGHFSEYSAGIPIKKRRFPLILQPSQSTEDSSSLPTENDSEDKGVSSPLQVSAISNASAVAESFSSVLTSSNTSPVAPSSNTSSIAASSNTSPVAASLNASPVAASSNSTGVVGNSNASCVAASLNIGCVAASSNLSSVTSGSNASSVVETSKINCLVASGTAASVSTISDANEKTVVDKEKESTVGTNASMVHSNSNLPRVKLEEQSFTVHSRSVADVVSLGKLVATGECDKILQKSAKHELDLVTDGSFTLNIGKDVYRQQNEDGNCRLESSTVSGNPGLSLGFEEHLLSAIASRNTEDNGRNKERAEPVSLNLSLSKIECNTQLRSNDVQPNNDVANMLADRSNWDLNTTMDAWEEPANNDVASQKTTHLEDIKPLICSAGMTGTSIPTRRLIPGEIEQGRNMAISSILSSQQYNTEDSLCLGLTTPSLPLNSTEKPSSSSVKVDLPKATVNSSLPGESVPVSNQTVVNLKPVKSEPLDLSMKTNSAAVKANPMGSLAQVKCEMVENARFVKPEPVRESKQEIPKRMEGSLNRPDEQMLCPLGTTTVPTSTDLSLHGDMGNQVEHLIRAKLTEPIGDLVASKLISSEGHDVNESNISGRIDNSTSENKTVEDPDHCRLKFRNVRLPDSRGTVEGSVSDEEKINLSGDILEEDSYGFDYESDGNRGLAAAMDMEHETRAEDDMEDGEVREPVENTETDAPISEGREAGNGSSGYTGYKNSDLVGFAGDENPSSSFVDKKETRREDPAETNNDNINECINKSVNKDSNTEAVKKACLHESSAVEMPSCQIDKTGPIEAMPTKPVDISENKNTVEEEEGDRTSIQASDTSQGNPVTIAQGADDAKKSDSEGKDNSAPKAEAFSSGDDAGKDVNHGGKRSRIINLSRASNQSCPGRTRSVRGRTLLSRAGRERLPDVALEGDKFHPRGRDEVYGDSSHRYSRERHHDQPSRNSRISFMRGRGRISSRTDTLCGDRDSERNFASEFYNGPTEFCVVRHNYASAVSDADNNFSSYSNGQAGAYFGTGRGGRKILSDESSIFPHLPPRRHSPDGRDGPAARGPPMVRRVPRNLSPSGCIGEDGSELVGLRHMRGFAEDHTDPMFTRSQPSFEGLDSPFVRGNREFSSVQRRGVPRIRSKSPTRPRNHSPGQWPSSRRRSPDMFGGPMELPRRRSPPTCRIERPDRPCFPEEMVLRRHGSPPYLSRPSNDLRDMDPGRDHGHLRPGIPNRSPSGQILLRNNRRMDLVDPRERNDGNDYFGGPMPPGRFQDLGTDGNADERRRYGDRRGPIRPFRPPYSGADGENFHLNAETGPRSFRFSPEEDPELHERGNLRGREFDRQIKNRPGNVPRRTRNIEGQEGNFRHGGQVWHDDGFDDMSRVKRKRF